MNFIKKCFTVVLAAVSILTAGCGDEPAAKNKSDLVAVSLPVKFPERWIVDGNELERNLIEKGYSVNLEYASENKTRQINFLNKAIEDGAKCLIIAPVEASALSEVCEKAKSKGIPVISYDRFIMDTDAVDYYITFDNTKVGELMGHYVEDKLNLAQNSDTHYMELFAGAPEDNNASMVYNGYMSVLTPYIEKGSVKILSEEDKFNEVATPKWAPELAEKRMDRLLKEYYPRGQRLDAVICPNDLLANAVISSLVNSGYKQHYPIITGQDADKVAIINILNDKQGATVFKDTRILAKKAVEMADTILKGGKPEINDEKTYDNNKKIVPSYLIEPVLVTKNNVTPVIIDSGYYTKVDIGLE
ncbi:MAG: sugar-binding protein [Selenomonadaceae bacterium]|nr:sugar-binding protein [Selenomonadaceae bacterium]